MSSSVRADEVHLRATVLLSAARGAFLAYETVFAAVAVNAFAISVADCKGKVLGGMCKASSILGILHTISSTIGIVAFAAIGARGGLSRQPRTCLWTAFGAGCAALGAQALLLLSREPDETVSANVQSQTRMQRPVLDTSGTLLVICGMLGALLLSQEATGYLTEVCVASFGWATRVPGRVFELCELSASAAQVGLATSVLALGFVGDLGAFEQGSLAAALTIPLAALLMGLGQRYLSATRNNALMNLEGTDKNECGEFQSVAVQRARSPQLRRFLIAAAFTSAARISSIPLLAVYAQFHLGLSSLRVTCILVVALAFALLGSLAAFWVAGFCPRRYLHLAYASLCMLAGLGAGLMPGISGNADSLDLAVVTAMRSEACSAPSATDMAQRALQEDEFTNVALIAAVCGALVGMAHALQRKLYAALVPRDLRDTASCVVKAASDRGLSWAGPLFIVVVNESALGLRWAPVVLAPMYWTAALGALFLDVERGETEVAAMLYASRVMRARCSEEAMCTESAAQDNVDDFGFFVWSRRTFASNGTRGAR